MKCLKLLGLIAAVAFGISALTIPNGWAGESKPSVASFSCTTDTTTGDVTATFTFKGVGNTDYCVVATGTFTADCICENGGDNCPSAKNKQGLGVASSTGQVIGATNGKMSGSEVLQAPDFNPDCTSSTCTFGVGGDTLNCPGGQTQILAKILEPGKNGVVVAAYSDFTSGPNNTCTPGVGASVIVSASCTPSPANVVCAPVCAALFP